MIDPQYYGPWAVIAGGSEGVGAGFADELSKIGINLVLIARKPGPLEETAAKARANGVEVRTRTGSIGSRRARPDQGCHRRRRGRPAHLQRRRQQLRPRVRDR